MLFETLLYENNPRVSFSDSADHFPYQVRKGQKLTQEESSLVIDSLKLDTCYHVQGLS